MNFLTAVARWIGRLLLRSAASGLFAGFVALIGAAAGLLASVYSQELKDSATLSWLKSVVGKFDVTNLIWVLIFGFGLLFWFGQWAQGRMNRPGFCGGSNL